MESPELRKLLSRKEAESVVASIGAGLGLGGLVGGRLEERL